MCVKRDIETQIDSLSTVHINYLVYIWKISDYSVYTRPHKGDGTWLTTSLFNKNSSCLKYTYIDKYG